MNKLFVIASVICVVFAYCYPVHSAPLYWAKTHQGIDNEVNCTQITSDGEILLAGYKHTAEGENSSFWVFKQDGDGNVLWEKTYGAIDTARAYAIQKTPDDNYVVAGTHGSTDMLLVKLDGNGAIIWQKTYYIGRNIGISSLITISEGGYVLTGDIYSLGSMWMDVFIMKIDNDGNVVWTKQYGRADKDAFDHPTSIIETVEGNYVVGGTTNSFGLNGDVFVMNLDSNGNIIWQKTYGAFYGEVAESIVQTNDGGLVIACIQGYNPARGNLWLLKLGGDGAISWQKVYVRENPIYLYSFKKTVDDGFIGAGFSALGDDTNTWIIRLDNNGNVVWDREFIGIEQNNTAVSLQATSDDGCIVSSLILFNDSSTNTLSLKLDSTGAIPGCDMFQSSSVSVSETTYSSGESAFSISTLASEGIDRNYIDRDVSTQVSLICCYDPEDNDFDCIAEEQDNCHNHGNPDQLDAYPPTSNAQAYWQLDEGAGIEVMDSAGDNDGALFGAAWVSGQVDNGLNFDGVNDYVEIADSPDLNPTTAITVEAWVKIMSSGLEDSHIISKWGPEGEAAYALMYDLGLTPYFIMYNGTAQVSIGGSEVLQFDTWCHLSGTADGSVARIYVNGHLSNEVVSSYLPMDNSYPLMLGKTAAGDEQYHHGVIDEAAIYNRALTPIEISRHYYEGLSGHHYAGNGIGDACDCEGNFNCAVDQDVDGSDAALFKTDFGRSSIEHPCIAGETCNGDFNCDGDVDGTDASLFKADFGRSTIQNPCPACEAGEWCMY